MSNHALAESPQDLSGEIIEGRYAVLERLGSNRYLVFDLKQLRQTVIPLSASGTVLSFEQRQPSAVRPHQPPRSAPAPKRGIVPPFPPDVRARPLPVALTQRKPSPPPPVALTQRKPPLPLEQRKAAPELLTPPRRTAPAGANQPEPSSRSGPALRVASHLNAGRGDPTGPQPLQRLRVDTHRFEAAWFSRGEQLEQEETAAEEVTDYGAYQAYLERLALEQH